MILLRKVDRHDQVLSVWLDCPVQLDFLDIYYCIGAVVGLNPLFNTICQPCWEPFASVPPILTACTSSMTRISVNVSWFLSYPAMFGTFLYSYEIDVQKLDGSDE
jgi:hypothetical protein